MQTINYIEFHLKIMHKKKNPNVSSDDSISRKKPEKVSEWKRVEKIIWIKVEWNLSTWQLAESTWSFFLFSRFYSRFLLVSFLLLDIFSMLSFLFRRTSLSNFTCNPMHEMQLICNHFYFSLFTIFSSLFFSLNTNT